jgi:hypothetical protein
MNWHWQLEWGQGLEPESLSLFFHFISVIQKDKQCQLRVIGCEGVIDSSDVD